MLRPIPRTVHSESLYYDVLFAFIQIHYHTIRNNTYCYSAFKYDDTIIARYRKCLNTAMAIATRCNVSPIHGHTIIMCNVSHENMDEPATGKNDVGTLHRSMTS